MDVGGSQNPVKKRLKIFEPDEYKILDLKEPHICKEKPDYTYDLNECIVNGVKADSNRGVDKFIEFDNKTKIEWEHFDIVFAIEIMEYIFDPIQALSNINSFLKKGGELFISFHTLYPIHQPTKDDVLRYTPNGAAKLLKKTGFEILEMKPRLFKHNEMWRDFYVSEGMRPAKDYDKHNWQGLLCKCKKL